MIELVLSFFGSYLIEVMSLVLVVALTLRWIAFKHSKRDEAYFSHFTRELSSTISEDKAKKTRLENLSDYLNDILGRVNDKLPERNLRKVFASNREGNRDQRVGLALKDYLESKHGLITNIQNESSVFTSKAQPDFSQLTDRVMNDDENWSKLFRTIPIDGVTRVLDVLPTMFIILGVFGTFIGISMALPEIAKIDFGNLEESGKSLSEFVVNVTFAMKTSIAGIFFSIILTVLNTIFPIDATRERTFDKVETVFHTLWYHLHNDQNKRRASDKELPKIRLIMEELLEEVRSQKTNQKLKEVS